MKDRGGRWRERERERKRERESEKPKRLLKDARQDRAAKGNKGFALLVAMSALLHLVFSKC
jgi:hypothetical protein